MKFRNKSVFNLMVILTAVASIGLSSCGDGSSGGGGGPSKQKDITQFTILDINGNIGPSSISLTVPYGTDVTNLTPTITHTGASISPESGAAVDFTDPVLYTVTAENGSTKVYTVTVNVALNSAKDITQFTILGINGTIGVNTIALTVPYGTDITDLNPIITITGESVDPASEDTQDFTNPVEYTVTAANGSTKVYTVTVNVALNSAKEITQFAILGINGTIVSNTIALTVPYGIDITDLTPTITITGESVDPASGDPQDFTNPVLYTVTAEDGSTNVYTVTVTEALNSAKDITQFTIMGINGTIGASTIALTVPYGTDITDLTPAISITGESVDPASGVPQSFSSPVDYTVSAEDGSTKVYTVTVTAALNSAKDITQFTILGINGTIGANTISLTVPYGTDLSNLTPAIIHTGASVNPASGVMRNFSAPVEYTVTAEDSTAKVYTVTVTAALNSAKDITKFTILGIDGTIGANTISLTVPYGTDLASLTPAITHTGAGISPASGVAQNFTSPVQYTVTAENGSTKIYTVTVTAALNSAKDITQFTIMGINGTIGADTISLTVPYGIALTDLTPAITHTGAGISPASGVPQNFISPVQYTVTAEDNSTKIYTVTVTAALNNAKDITQFSILGINGTIGVDTISLTVPYGTDLTSLTPAITHTGAGISPASGIMRNFSGPVQYTVTAENGSTKIYTVTVTAALNSAKDITKFTILGIDGTIGANTISLTVPYGTNLASLTPTITHTGVSISPASGAAQNFSAPVDYIITAEDSSTKVYTVTVTAAINSAKDITKFTILGINGTIGASTIALTVPYGTNVTNLTPSITHTGAGISPASGTAQNFTGSVQYTVTAEDSTTKVYTVNVSVASNSSKDITQFTIMGINGTIGVNTISLTVPFGTDITDLTPAITHTGASISPVSGVSRNFSAPVEYTVTAEDGSTKVYTVNVSVALNSAKDITQFTILGINGTIGANTISLTVPYGTDRSSLTPAVTHTGAGISPASGVAQNFTNPVEYTVTAEDSSTKVYTVTVSVALNYAKDITQFSIMGINGTIGVNTISLTVPYGTNRTNLMPAITHTGASINPASGAARDFSSPVTYTVTAEDGSTKVYTVTVSVALNFAKDITRFTILGIDGTIGANTISLTVPYGTDLSDLTPEITHTGASIDPASGIPLDFSSPVEYTVTAEDSSTKVYTVTVSAALNFAKDITQFTILGINGTIGVNTISLTVPYGTSRTSLTPAITHTGASINPASGAARDFSSPVTYTVTAEDSSTKEYTVTVSVALNFAKDITQFTILGIDGTIGVNTISLTVPYGTNRTNLTPAITHTGASINPASGAARDFSSPVTYTVTAEDGTIKVYTVTVSVALNFAKDITQFTILGINGTIGANTIALTVPYGTNRSSLTPTITHTGASISPASGVAQNFTNPVTYTVSAENASTKIYTVTVTMAPNPAKDITQFTILGINGTIGVNTIALTVPYGTSKSSLTPTITHTGASISPASGVAQNFTSPVQYTVTAENGSTKVYTVTVSVAPNTAKDITQFTILGINGNVGVNTITLTVPYGTSKTSLTPTITHTGASISPASGTAQNFTNPVQYTVTAEDSSTKVYTVTVSVALNPAKEITQFTILGINGTIGANTIALTVPYGTSKTSLTPTITHTGASISPASGVAQNFTNPVNYTVTAADSTTKVYTVTVSVAPNPAKDITQFTILGVNGTIGSSTITLTLPYGTNVTSLTPTITITGASIIPASGVPQNFTNPVNYTVTAADSSTKVYTVTVSLTADPSIPTIKAAAWLTVPSGSVVYVGVDPASTANPKTNKTLTFSAGGTFKQVWKPNGYDATTNGNWSYDANHKLTLYHTGKIMGLVTITVTEIYDAAFTYNNGTKMTMTAYKQTSTSPHGGPLGSTVIGTFNLHANIHLKVTGMGQNVDDIMDTVGTLNITGPSGNNFPWNTSTVTSTDGTPGSPVTASGNLVIPTDVWLYNIGTAYYKEVDFTYTLTKQ